MNGEGSTMKKTSASELFLRGIEQLSRSLRNPRNQNTIEPQIQAAEAFREKQAEHERQKGRVNEAIAAGARLSRKRAL